MKLGIENNLPTFMRHKIRYACQICDNSLPQPKIALSTINFRRQLYQTCAEVANCCHIRGSYRYVAYTVTIPSIGNTFTKTQYWQSFYQKVEEAILIGFEYVTHTTN